MLCSIRHPLGWAVAVLALAGGVGAKVYFSTPARADTVAAGGDASGEPEVPAPTGNVAVWLIRVGLDAKALAAAGLSSANVSALVQRAKAHLASTGSAIPDADAAYGVARKAADALERKVQSGLASQEEVGSLVSAKSALSTASATRTATLDALFTAAVADLTDAQRSALTLARTHATTWGEISVEYRVVARTEPQWVALRDALACKRIAAQLGEELDAASASLLAQVDSESAIASAKAHLSTYESAAKTAWNTAAVD